MSRLTPDRAENESSDRATRYRDRSWRAPHPPGMSKWGGPYTPQVQPASKNTPDGTRYLPSTAPQQRPPEASMNSDQDTTHVLAAYVVVLRCIVAIWL